MRTDPLLIGRLAAELDAELRGGRVVDGGLLDDGRFGLRVAGRRGRPPVTLAVDLFGSPPLATLEDAELALGTDPGWARAIASALRGQRIARVRSRPGDRVLAIDLGTTSRFGVGSTVTLILELVPRFGNAVLIRDGLVLAAAKQFSPADNEVRSVTVGGPYRPPPLRAAQAAALPDASGDGLRNAVHAYFDGDDLIAVGLEPLPEQAGREHRHAALLLPLLAQVRAQRARRHSGDALERRRARLLGTLERRRRDAAAEVARVTARRDDAAGRERLRAAGDALYTYGPQVPPGAERFSPPDRADWVIDLDPALDAKANAARYFSRYRKAADALPHLERRLAALTARRDSLEALAFEAERADPTGLLEVEQALAELDGRAGPVSPARARRHPVAIERPSGARVYLGRSPAENVDITFRIARPDDLWFHARGIPGSHVVLQPPPGAPADEADLTFAADLAARHSRARGAARVEIDFTERKHVRKQRDAAPGLVWYTNARTRVGRTDAPTG
jgi:predicted ribosome quality control (RQC) complex YloA/Tae2 family protein